MVLRSSWSESLREFGIDIEDDRHLPLLAGRKALLGEAEAVDLVEIAADRGRRHVVGRLSGGLARGQVGDGVVDRHHFAEPHVDRGPLRLEPPWQAGADIGIEPNRDLPIGDLCRRHMGDQRGAAEPGGAAEPAVERDRRIGHADHDGHEHAARGGEQDVALAHRAWTRTRVGRVHGFTRVHSGRRSTPGPSLTMVTT